MTETSLPKNDSNLIWIDLEMTGLYPDRDRIIEIAVVVTDALVRPVSRALSSRSTRATRRSMRWTRGTRAPTARAV
jgi:Oligoribonuclease (3''->5'' exoribonuclease)